MQKENNPFFSVVIPSYNRAHLLPKAIESVVNQTFGNWELIIADDCSTDNTVETVKPFLCENIHIIQNKVNKGNAGARNLGIKKAIGQYVCFLDSDDKYHDHFLEKMYNLIQKNNSPGFLWCNVNRIDANGKLLNHSAPAHWKPMEAKDPYIFFLNGLYFGTDFGFTVKKECFEKTGFFDENLRVAVDSDFMLRIVQDFSFANTLEVLVDTYDHAGDRVRKDSGQKLRSYKIMFEKHKESIKKYNHLKQRWYHKLMWLSYHNGKKKEARQYLEMAVKAGNYKSALAAGLFEVMPVEQAIKMHKQISAAL